jgi:hypothetical protein
MAHPMCYPFRIAPEFPEQSREKGLSMTHYVFETRAGRVTDYRLPGAIFQNRAAYDEFAPERHLYEATVATYAAEIDPGAIKRAVRASRAAGHSFITAKVVRESAEMGLQESLLALPGYSEDDVQWHLANPGVRDAVGFYIHASDF